MKLRTGTHAHTHMHTRQYPKLQSKYWGASIALLTDSHRSPAYDCVAPVNAQIVSRTLAHTRAHPSRVPTARDSLWRQHIYRLLSAGFHSSLTDELRMKRQQSCAFPFRDFQAHTLAQRQRIRPTVRWSGPGHGLPFFSE